MTLGDIRSKVECPLILSTRVTIAEFCDRHRQVSISWLLCLSTKKINVMIKLSSGSNYSNKYSSEMTGEVTNLHQKHKLPCHISSLESSSYNRSHLNKLQTLSACPLVSASPTSNAAWNILKYQLSRPSQQKHLANLQSNLEHRLSVARVQGNERLIQILQEESRQLQNS